MSAMEGFFVLDSENIVVVGDKTLVEKTAKGYVGSVPRKKLSDISNLTQQPKPSNNNEKSQSISATTKEYIDQLKKENMELMKLLSDRNKIIELSGIELQTLRINLQKMQLQNSQLAQSNSLMLMELNSAKDRLKALHHELGCKNGLLKAKELEIEEKAKDRTCPKVDNEVAVTKGEQAQKSSKPDNGDNKLWNRNKRQQSKSLAPSSVNQVQAKEKAENKRLCVRRQSARFKYEESKCSDDLLGIDDTKFPPCPFVDDQMQESCSTTICSSVKQEVEEVKQEAKEKAENKRLRVRRQSARFKSEESKCTDDLFEIDDAKSPACPLVDDQMQENFTTTCSSVKEVKEGYPAPRYEGQEFFARSSIGRPSRHAAQKVMSYKEIPLNVKMRRNA